MRIRSRGWGLAHQPINADHHHSALRRPFTMPGCSRTTSDAGSAAHSPAEPRMVNASADPLLAPFRFRSIGPASMGGRIDDIAVADSDPNIIYLGYAVGGVFKSENNGTTLEPVFDEYTTASIGDIAIHPTNANIVYVGTGEPNNRQTSSFGDGIYKTTDGGKTWQNIGLTRDADHRPHRHRSPESRDRLRRGARSPVRTQQGTRRLQDDGRRRELEPGQVHRRGHRIHRHRHRSGRTPTPLCGELSASTHGLLLQRRRSGQRAVEDHGRRQELDEADGPACRPAPTAASRSTSPARIPTSSTRRSRPANRPAADDRRRTIPARQPRAHRPAPPQCRARHPRPRNPAQSPKPRGRGAAAATPAGAVRLQPRGGRVRRGGSGGGRGFAYNWCNNAGPGSGFGRGTQQAAGTTPVPPPLDPAAWRHLPLGEQGRHLDARQQLQRAADVFQPAARRSDQRQGGVRGRPAGDEIARRRALVRHARRGRRLQRARATSISTRSGSIRRTRSTC